MSLKLSEDEIWFWYNKIIEQKRSNISTTAFCRKHDLEYKKFSNLKYRMLYTQHLRPKEYEEYVEWARKLLESGMTISRFCKEYNVSRIILTEAKTHIQYMDIINRLKLERGEPENNMNFVKLKTSEPKEMFSDPIYQINAPSEVMEPRNDIEIAITKGVKVFIAPTVESTKIIRIIELLKDL